MQCYYNSFIQIINFHGLFRNECSEVPKNWCLPNTGALTVFAHFFENYVRNLFCLQISYKKENS